jgi:hypothetical protein
VRSEEQVANVNAATTAKITVLLLEVIEGQCGFAP